MTKTVGPLRGSHRLTVDLILHMTFAPRIVPCQYIVDELQWPLPCLTSRSVLLVATAVERVVVGGTGAVCVGWNYEVPHKRFGGF